MKEEGRNNRIKGSERKRKEGNKKGRKERSSDTYLCR